MNEELNQIEEMQEVEQRTFEDMSKDELLEVVYQLLQEEENLIPVSTENVQGFELNEDEFSDGVYNVSKTCGMISALRSIGLTIDQALDYVMNEKNIDFNLKHNAQTCESNEKQAKYQQYQNQV